MVGNLIKNISGVRLHYLYTPNPPESDLKAALRAREGSTSRGLYLCGYPTNGWTCPFALIRREFQLNHETLPFASYRQVSPPPYTANGAMIESLSSRSFWCARRCLQSPIQAIVAFIHFYAAYSGQSPLATYLPCSKGGRVAVTPK